LKQAVCFIAQPPYRVRQENKANARYRKLGKETAAGIYGELSFYAFGHHCSVINTIDKTEKVNKEVLTYKFLLLFFQYAGYKYSLVSLDVQYFNGHTTTILF